MSELGVELFLPVSAGPELFGLDNLPSVRRELILERESTLLKFHHVRMSALGDKQADEEWATLHSDQLCWDDLAGKGHTFSGSADALDRLLLTGERERELEGERGMLSRLRDVLIS